MYTQLVWYFAPATTRHKYLIDAKIAELNIRPSKTSVGDASAKSQATIAEIKRRFKSLFTNPNFVHQQHSAPWRTLLAQSRIVAVRTIDPEQYTNDQRALDPDRLAQLANQIHGRYQKLGVPKAWVRLGVIKLHSKDEGQGIVGKLPLRQSTQQIAGDRTWCTIELSPQPQSEYKLGYFRYIQGDFELYEGLHQHLCKYIESKNGNILYSPEMVIYRDQHYLLYPEVVCGMRHTDSAGHVRAHLNTLARLELAEECANRDLADAQRALAEDTRISDAGLAEDGITRYIADGFVDEVNDCTYQVLKITDKNYSESYRASVFGAALNSCGVAKVGGKYVVFKVVMIHNEAETLEHAKFVYHFGRELAKALYAKRG